MKIFKIIGTEIKKKLMSIGFDINKFLKWIKNPIWVHLDFKEFKKQKGKDKTFKFGRNYFIFSDKDEQGGVMSGHYFHQDLYVARMINLAKPLRHIDIGSRTDGFVAHVASFREIEVIDIRNIRCDVKNITFKQGDLMKLPNNLIDYCDSISSLHAIEHFGLGRYGDPIDYYGHLKAIENISKILKENGVFYFSVPIGPQRVEFNAHRVFSVEYLNSILSQYFVIKSFSFVDDNGDFFENVELTDNNIKENFVCKFGCGIYILIKK